MALFSMLLLDANAEVAAVQLFQAQNLRQAGIIAAGLGRSRPDIAGYELWEGKERLLTAARTDQENLRH